MSRSNQVGYMTKISSNTGYLGSGEPSYNRPSPGKKIGPAGRQEPHKKVGKHPMPPAPKTKLRPYGSTSFAGRPFGQTGDAHAPNKRG